MATTTIGPTEINFSKPATYDGTKIIRVQCDGITTDITIEQNKYSDDWSVVKTTQGYTEINHKKHVPTTRDFLYTSHLSQCKKWLGFYLTNTDYPFATINWRNAFNGTLNHGEANLTTDYPRFITDTAWLVSIDRSAAYALAAEHMKEARGSSRLELNERGINELLNPINSLVKASDACAHMAFKNDDKLEYSPVVIYENQPRLAVEYGYDAHYIAMLEKFLPHCTKEIETPGKQKGSCVGRMYFRRQDNNEIVAVLIDTAISASVTRSCGSVFSRTPTDSRISAASLPQYSARLQTN